MLKNGDGVAGMIPLVAQRAVEDFPRWTRAVGIIPPTPYKATGHGVAAAIQRFLLT